MKVGPNVEEVVLFLGNPEGCAPDQKQAVLTIKTFQERICVAGSRWSSVPSCSSNVRNVDDERDRSIACFQRWSVKGGRKVLLNPAVLVFFTNIFYIFPSCLDI